LPGGLSYEHAAHIFCAGYTFYSGLRFADPKPHECIALLGVGGLGHLAIQYSKAAGFETIALTHLKDTTSNSILTNHRRFSEWFGIR
jgi:alcohol dehydrogenase